MREDERGDAPSELGRRVFVFAGRQSISKHGIKQDRRLLGIARHSYRNGRGSSISLVVSGYSIPPNIKATPNPILFFFFSPTPFSPPPRTSFRCRESRAHPRKKDTHLSLHPRPVVNPIPPWSNLPSRCLTLLRGVSLVSLACFEHVLVVDINDRFDAFET